MLYLIKIRNPFFLCKNLQENLKNRIFFQISLYFCTHKFKYQTVTKYETSFIV